MPLSNSNHSVYRTRNGTRPFIIEQITCVGLQVCGRLTGSSRPGSLSHTSGGRSDPYVVTASAPVAGRKDNEETVDVVRVTSSRGYHE